MRFPNSVRAVSIFEATKGAVVLLAGFGILSLIHHDVQKTAEQLVEHLHLNPAKHYPRIFLDTAAQLTNTRLQMMSVLAMLYAVLRFVEAYGLWRQRRWAEWFAAVSGAIYIPFEFLELVKRFDALSVSVLVVNLLIVGLMVKTLSQKRSTGE